MFKIRRQLNLADTTLCIAFRSLVLVTSVATWLERVHVGGNHGSLILAISNLFYSKIIVESSNWLSKEMMCAKVSDITVDSTYFFFTIKLYF